MSITNDHELKKKNKKRHACNFIFFLSLSFTITQKERQVIPLTIQIYPVSGSG